MMRGGSAFENHLLIEFIPLWRTLRVTPDVALQFVRALAVKDLTQPGGLPSALDVIWHRALLETQDYQTLCERLRGPGIFVHHTTKSAADDDDVARQSRVDSTVHAYRKRYREEPDPELWDDDLAVEVPSFQVFVKILNGKVVTMPNVMEDTRILTIKRYLEIREGTAPAEQQQLIYGGRALADEKTCGDYGVTNYSTLHLVLNLRGC